MVIGVIPMTAVLTTTGIPTKSVFPAARTGAPNVDWTVRVILRALPMDSMQTALREPLRDIVAPGNVAAAGTVPGIHAIRAPVTGVITGGCWEVTAVPTRATMTGLRIDVISRMMMAMPGDPVRARVTGEGGI